MPKECAYEGEKSRKFGGAVVFDDCDEIINYWLDPQPVFIVTGPAV